MSKNIYFKGRYYKSIRSCFEENKDDIEVSYQVLIKNLASGLSIDKAVKKQPRKKYKEKLSKYGKILVEGKEYDNLRLLAEEYGINVNTMYQHYYRGKRGDDLIPLKKRKNYVEPIPNKKYKYYLDNKGFNSYTEISKHYNVKFPTIRKRLERGLSLEQAVGILETPDLRIKKDKPKKVVRKANEVELIVDGVKYKSITHLAKSFSMADITVRKRILEQGLSPEEAVKRPIKKTTNTNLYVDGVKYDSIPMLARAYNLNPSLVYQRIKYRGYSPEEAVKKQPRKKGKIVSVAGKKFNSISEAARFYDKSIHSVRDGLNRGQTIEQALGLEKYYRKNAVLYDWNEKKYTIDELTTQLSKEYKIPKKLLHNRIYYNGLSINQAIKNGNKKVVGSGRYNLKILKRDPELANKKSELYFVLIKNEEKSFYKIGITTRTTRKRLNGLDYEILSINKGKLIEMFNHEQYLLDRYNDNKLGDDLEVHFEGKTELLFLNSKEVDEILSYMDLNK